MCSGQFFYVGEDMTNEVNDKGVFLNEVYTEVKKQKTCNECFKLIDPNSSHLMTRGCERPECKHREYAHRDN